MWQSPRNPTWYHNARFARNISTQLSFLINLSNINSGLTNAPVCKTLNFTPILNLKSVVDQAVNHRVFTTQARVNPIVTKSEKPTETNCYGAGYFSTATAVSDSKSE